MKRNYTNNNEKLKENVHDHITALTREYCEYEYSSEYHQLEQMLRLADNISFDIRQLMLSTAPVTFRDMVFDYVVESAGIEVVSDNGALYVRTPLTVNRRYSEKRYLADTVRVALNRYCQRNNTDLFLFIPPKAAVIMVKHTDGRQPESDPCNEDSVIINTICGELGISDNWAVMPAFLNMKIRCSVNEKPGTEFIFLPLERLHEAVTQLEKEVLKAQ